MNLRQCAVYGDARVETCRWLMATIRIYTRARDSNHFLLCHCFETLFKAWLHRFIGSLTSLCQQSALLGYLCCDRHADAILRIFRRCLPCASRELCCLFIIPFGTFDSLPVDMASTNYHLFADRFESNVNRPQWSRWWCVFVLSFFLSLSVCFLCGIVDKRSAFWRASFGTRQVWDLIGRAQTHASDLLIADHRLSNDINCYFR